MITKWTALNKFFKWDLSNIDYSVFDNQSQMKFYILKFFKIWDETKNK